MPDFAVILPAAGKAVRFGGDKNKLLCELAGATILERSVAAFLIRRDVRQIIIPTSEPMMNAIAHCRLDDPRIEVRAGGPSRAHSVRNALSHVKPGIEWVAVHDAARPLVSQNLIDATLAAAVEHGAAAPALPVSLTIKQALGPLPAKVERTVPRANLWAMQTPQIMRVADLHEAYERCPIALDQVTDDVQLLELQGREVWLIPGDGRNLKITTQSDLRLAELLSPA